MKNKLHLILYALSIFIFSGCFSITKELQPLSTYNLTIEKNILKDDYFIDKSINIYEPKTVGSLNSRDIIYSQDNIKFDIYALNKWIDKPSRMLQKQIANYLSLSSSYKYITTSNLKVSSDYSLVSEISEFYQEFIGDESYSKFSIRVYLIDNKTNQVLYKQFSYKQKCSSNDAKGFVESMNQITNYFYKNLNKFIKKLIK